MGGITKSIIGLVLGVVLAAILVFAFMAFRAMNYGGPLDIDQVELPPPPAIDHAVAVQRLGEAIRFKTVTYKAGDPATAEAAQPLSLIHI